VREGLYIGHGIRVTIDRLQVRPDGSTSVKVAIEAPPNVAVTRETMGLATHMRAQGIRERERRAPTRAELLEVRDAGTNPQATNNGGES
jgi:sRNA-binding carbon storage regulator CsrA